MNFTEPTMMMRVRRSTRKRMRDMRRKLIMAMTLRKGTDQLKVFFSFSAEEATRPRQF